MPKFIKNWLDLAKYKSWLQEDPDDVCKAFCKVCDLSLNVSNLGLLSIEKHSKGNGHIQRICPARLNNPIMVEEPNDDHH